MNGEEKEAKIAALKKENQALRERIAELERRLGIDSQTSSKPPSSDGLKKKNHRTKSLRGKSLRKTGGQKSHPGQTLEQVIEPDTMVTRRLNRNLVSTVPETPRPRPIRGDYRSRNS